MCLKCGAYLATEFPDKMRIAAAVFAAFLGMLAVSQSANPAVEREVLQK